MTKQSVPPPRSGIIYSLIRDRGFGFLRGADGTRFSTVEASHRGRTPAWRDIERRVRHSLTDWRALLAGDVAEVRRGFRQFVDDTDPVHAVCGEGTARHSV